MDDNPDPSTPAHTHQGHAQVPNWMVRDTTISGRAKLIYLCLSSRTSREMTAWPSHALMAQEAGISVTSVKAALAELKALGVVNWQSRRNPNGGQTSNVYTVHITPTPSRGAPTP